MTLRHRMDAIERKMPEVRRAAPVASPLLKVIAFVGANGGRLPSESWAEATARLCGVTTSQLMAKLRGQCP